MKFHGKYIVSIRETVLISLFSVFGRADCVLVAEYTSLLSDPWVCHLVAGEA